MNCLDEDGSSFCSVATCTYGSCTFGSSIYTSEAPDDPCEETGCSLEDAFTAFTAYNDGVIIEEHTCTVAWCEWHQSFIDSYGVDDCENNPFSGSKCTIYIAIEDEEMCP